MYQNHHHRKFLNQGRNRRLVDNSWTWIVFAEANDTKRRSPERLARKTITRPHQKLLPAFQHRHLCHSRTSALRCERIRCLLRPHRLLPFPGGIGEKYGPLTLKLATAPSRNAYSRRWTYSLRKCYISRETSLSSSGIHG
jgi:hypothetical protein